MKTKRIKKKQKYEWFKRWEITILYKGFINVCCMYARAIFYIVYVDWMYVQVVMYVKNEKKEVNDKYVCLR